MAWHMSLSADTVPLEIWMIIAFSFVLHRSIYLSEVIVQGRPFMKALLSCVGDVCYTNKALLPIAAVRQAVTHGAVKKLILH